MDPLTAVPDRLIAGDSVSIVRPFPSVAGLAYTVKLRFIAPDGTIAPITASEADGAFTFAVLTTTLATMEPGVISWAITAEKVDERITLEASTLTLLADPANTTTAATSTLAHIERVIAACKARLEDKLTDDVQMYQLPGGVTVSKLTLREVRELLASYETRRARILRRGRPSVIAMTYARR